MEQADSVKHLGVTADAENSMCRYVANIFFMCYNGIVSNWLEYCSITQQRHGLVD